MMYVSIIIGVVAFSLGNSVTAFVGIPVPSLTYTRRTNRHTTSILRSPATQLLVSNKPDLFSDDLFDDEDTEPKMKEVNEPEGNSKKKYLDQKWKLNSEDAKDFKGFPKKDAGEAAPMAEVVPCFALMYRFRKEYIDTSVDEALSDHRGHAAKFKRLLNSEVINMGKAKGVVLLWAGFTETDQVETKAEIMTFLEDDPLITKDIVENWDLINLQERAGPKKTLPADTSATA